VYEIILYVFLTYVNLALLLYIDTGVYLLKRLSKIKLKCLNYAQIIPMLQTSFHIYSKSAFSLTTFCCYSMIF